MTMRHVLPSGVTLERRDAPAGPADLPPHVLERIALRWAENAGCPPDQVVLGEEELGWSIQAPGAATSYATFVDKVTGRIVSFANPAYLSEQYGKQLTYERGLLPRAGADGPRVEPPGLVAEVAVGSSTARAAGVRTDEPPVLHPFVRARLAAIPARERVRGAEWHPELTALGKVVQGPDDPGAEVRLWRVREPGDPNQGTSTATPCDTCTRVLGVRPFWPVRESGPPAGDSRWQRLLARRRLHHRPAPDRARVAERIEQTLAARGVEHRHAVSPAAVEALERYLGADSTGQAPGRSVRTAPFHIDPAWAADTADTLARVAARVGAPLFPLGTAGHEGFLAVDPGGRVFLVDGTGEWSLGTGLPAALDTLLLGRAATRVREPR
ncbi:SUKH-3 domain-containing protein [Actinoplanes sp. NPDC049599]|uniref:SUKH-3 domain-containing protein n=1 Tax=Actinoplanes sp. NPDC049599 TaxID=3363903 RepID=UPI0037B10EC1